MYADVAQAVKVAPWNSVIMATGTVPKLAGSFAPKVMVPRTAKR